MEHDGQGYPFSDNPTRLDRFFGNEQTRSTGWQADVAKKHN